jgi:hypothetical protein
MVFIIYIYIYIYNNYNKLNRQNLDVVLVQVD